MDANSKGGAALAPTPSSLSYPTQEAPRSVISLPKDGVSPTTTTEEKKRVVRPRPQIVIPSIGPMIQAYGGVLFLFVSSALLWLTDGYFSLWFLRGWIPALGTVGLIQWIIPVLFTLGQLFFWPRKDKFVSMWEARGIWLDEADNSKLRRRYERARTKLISHVLLFGIITVFNVGTSAQGIYEWADGRSVNMFGGFQLPDAGTSLRVWSTIGGIITAFGAEKLFSWAKAELSEI